MGEDRRAAVPRVAHQVDENVDAVLRDPLSRRAGVERPHIDEPIERAGDPLLLVGAVVDPDE